MKFFFILALFAMAGTADAEHLWVNNITVDEYNITWGYTDTFTGADSVSYRMGIDAEPGNNDGYIGAWELLKADKEMRKKFRDSIASEPDVKINNLTAGIEVIDVEAALAAGTIGKTHNTDTIVNRYSVTYRFKEGIFNATSLWFLGQANTPVTIVMPVGVEIMNISGMDNVTKNITDRTEISGFFKGMKMDRGEITLNLTWNASIPLHKDNITPEVTIEKVAEPMTETLSKIRDASIVGVGIVIIILIYVFKVRK